MTWLKLIYHCDALLKSWFFKLIFGKKIEIGKGTTWRKSFQGNIVKGKLSIGKNCFFNNYCSLNVLRKVEIGDNSIFGENVKIYDHNHRFNKKEIRLKDQGYSIGSVKVGRNCWIGSNVILLKGAEIGDNCVIGAGCVIDGKIPADSIVKNKNKYVIEEINFK